MNVDDLPYIQVYRSVSIGSGVRGVQILITKDSNVDASREANPLLHRAIWDAGEKIIAEIEASQIAKNPDSALRAQNEREKLLACFPEKIFVKEIPNGYCNRSCCRHLPWFVVTTHVGPITIGWRKSVISIDWSESLVQTDAKTLFPDEDVTRYDSHIHAWGYEKAAQYLKVILA